MVSGVTIVATCMSRRRPSRAPTFTKRRRSSSVNRSRRFPSCTLRIRFSSRRYRIASVCSRWSQPRRDATTSCAEITTRVYVNRRLNIRTLRDQRWRPGPHEDAVDPQGSGAPWRLTCLCPSGTRAVSKTPRIGLTDCAQNSGCLWHGSAVTVASVTVTADNTSAPVESAALGSVTSSSDGSEPPPAGTLPMYILGVIGQFEREPIRDRYGRVWRAPGMRAGGPRSRLLAGACGRQPVSGVCRGQPPLVGVSRMFGVVRGVSLSRRWGRQPCDARGIATFRRAWRTRAGTRR